MTRLSRRVVAILGAVTGTATVGCGGDLEAVRDGFDSSLCVGEEAKYLEGIRPAEPVDFVALRQTLYEGDWEGRTVEQVGACSTDSSCTSLGLLLEGEQDVRAYPKYPALVIARAQEASLLEDTPQWRDFLGEIDSAEEAGLMALKEGYPVDCSQNNVRQVVDGFLIYSETGNTCGGDILAHRVFVDQTGEVVAQETAVVEKGDRNCAIGRVPSGLRAQGSERRRVGDCVGEYFAEVSRLEAASVVAFEQLALELAEHGAAPDLVRDAQRAAGQEVRHALWTGALARRFGAERIVPSVKRPAPRPLLELALDNAVEGLTRETFGALLGGYQAARAEHQTVRQVMARIARDELGHAQLSERIHQWVMPKLTASEREQVGAARASAVQRFRRQVHRAASARLQRLAGLPSEQRSRQLFDQLFAGV